MKTKIQVTELPKSCSKCQFYSEIVGNMGYNDYAKLPDCSLNFFDYNDEVDKNKVHKKCKLKINKTFIKL
jgi:hypothetical protein